MNKNFKNIAKVKAIDAKNEKRILAVNPHVNDRSGIYFLTRKDSETGIRFSYVGQARHIKSRLLQHLRNFQRIDISLKSHGLKSEDNPDGWDINFINYPLEKLDEMERYYITLYALKGYQSRNIDTGGGPFGAVIVKDGEVIATGTNRVVPDSDPTAHAEVMAIRKACAKLGTFQLTGCTVYSSCEPCPMCLSALYWAGVSRICYGNTKDDAKAINFDDSFIYDELELPKEQRSKVIEELLPEEAMRTFDAWRNNDQRREY